MKMSSFLILFLTLILTAVYPAQAQEQGVNAAQPQAEKKQSKKIPDAYIIEAQSFLAECSRTQSYSSFYNCDCMAAHLLDQRIKQGPEANKTSIIMEIRGQCKDASETAGQQYQRCLGKPNVLPPGYDPKQFCECYAKRYGEMFEESGASVSARSLTNLQVASRAQCRRELRGR